MARADLLSRLYLSSQSALEFNFDALRCNYNIFDIFSTTDMGDINYITTSVKYMGDIKTRLSMIEDLMKRRGFKKYHAGTNRQVYIFLDDRTFVAKTPIDSNGMKDNVTEFGVQLNIKPCCTKTFQISEFGEIAFCEKVDPIQTKEEFLSVADDIFYMLVYKILGKYIMDDIGTLKFMNYGIRRGWGPVILDYAKTFKLDGNKLICNKELYQGIYCNGEIDYDEGFNNIVCKSCGTHYNAMELAELTSQHKIILSKGDFNMNVRLIKKNSVIVDSTKSPKEMETIKKEKPSINPILIKTEPAKPLFEDETEYDETEYDATNSTDTGDNNNEDETEYDETTSANSTGDNEDGYDISDDALMAAEEEHITEKVLENKEEKEKPVKEPKSEILPKPLKNLKTLNDSIDADDNSMQSRPASKKRKAPAKQSNTKELLDKF